MRVQCRFCENESAGFCSKKKQGGKPKKIKLRKRRSCDKYKEDALRVLDDYRKREAHKAIIKAQYLRQARINAFLAKRASEDSTIIKGS